MTSSINETMLGLGKAPSAIRELFAYGLDRKAEIGEDKVFDFSIGNPSVPAPASVAKTIAELAQADPVSVHGYSAGPGLADVRSAIADNLNARFSTRYTSENLYLTCGAAASISISLKAVVDPGDEVIVITPYFPEYRVWIQTHGATCIEVPARESDFQIDIDAVAAVITPATKAVIINTPNNPVGVIYTRETLKALADVLTARAAEAGHAIYLISDEPYRELAFGGLEVPWVPDLYADTIVCYSWSKSLSLPGERIGYILVPDTVTQWRDVFAAVCGAGRALGFVCAPVLFQRVIAASVGEPADTAAYERNRELLTGVMDRTGFDYIAPDGAFYLWVKSPDPDARAFAERAKAHELLVVPSDSFGVPGWVRLGYCIADHVIIASEPAFAALRAEYA